MRGGGPQSHSLHPFRRDNLYRVELEPPTSMELRYQRVRRGRGEGVGGRRGQRLGLSPGAADTVLGSEVDSGPLSGCS